MFEYGLVIILITILTRVFVVSISWNYGLFLVALKQTFPNAHFSELGWISGLAQGVGSLISPLYVVIYKQLGIRTTFTLGFTFCVISLLTSSFVPNQHYLFFTYSIPFGIGSNILMVLGTVLTGMYYPINHKHHITSTVAISLGFPLGFLFLNPLTEYMLTTFKNDWQLVQRIYSLTTFLCLLLSSAFFTDKYADKQTEIHSNEHDITKKQKGFLNLSQKQFDMVINAFWYFAILLNSCANNSVLIHLTGYLKSISIDELSLQTVFLVLGSADLAYRVSIAVFGRFIGRNLIVLYALASFVGFVLSFMWWSFNSSIAINKAYSLLFAMCPAVFMSLMYPINSELTGPSKMKTKYTTNVAVSGLGVILGPVLSGSLLDYSNKNYHSVFEMTAFLYLISFLVYSTIKLLLFKHAKYANEHQIETRQDYIEFENQY